MNEKKYWVGLLPICIAMEFENEIRPTDLGGYADIKAKATSKKYYLAAVKVYIQSKSAKQRRVPFVIV